MNKPIIGISQGDPNGVGMEIIIKTLQHPMIYDYCIPVLYANPKTFAFTKKVLGLDKPMYVSVRDISEIKGHQLNLITSSQDAFEVNFGQASAAAGKEAIMAIDRMLQDAVDGKLHGMVTAPIDKSSIQIEGFTGHTSYISNKLGVEESLMILYNDDVKVGLLTEHLPLSQVPSSIKKDKIVSKLKIASDCLKRDFGIVKPKIAVLGLNPHNGDNGKMGMEEKDIIEPAVKEAQEAGINCYGPYSADGFFGMKSYVQFDLVLAMYHDQGLIPFKSIAFEDGINYTAGLPVVRTSPDHGTAYDIAGKNSASTLSFVNAIFEAIDIYHKRIEEDTLRDNPLGYSEFRRERFRLEQA
ncbi:MAG: 4-hydroxythreonine-4-phosphate dehydrogenase PdxA [Bacteroidia bacterium]|nr:4-hydroxythreonine-4-phosphate dehydrogenase PdxA [Bacteroidia bacterium]